MIVGYQREEELAKKIDSIRFKVLKSEVLKLPPQHFIDVPIVLPPKVRRQYDDMQKELIMDMRGGVVTAANAMVATLKLRQIASGHIRDEDQKTHDLHGAKHEWLHDFLVDLDESENVVVFCQFTRSLEHALETAEKAGRPTQRLDGSTKERDHFAQWAPEPGTVLVANWQSGGTGIDLTAAATCVFYDPTYSGGDFDQAVARLHRPGQERHVKYYSLLAEKSIDAKVQRALESRRDVIEAIMSLAKED